MVDSCEPREDVLGSITGPGVSQTGSSLGRFGRVSLTRRTTLAIRLALADVRDVAAFRYGLNACKVRPRPRNHQ